VTFEALKETFTAKGQAQYIDYLDNITGRGYWTLSTNHLAPNNPALSFGVPGKSAYSIQDAMLMQDYPPPIGANGKARAGIPTYPMTLLWYPRIRLDPDSREFEQCWLANGRGISPAS
jgi:hypothetical protein